MLVLVSEFENGMSAFVISRRASGAYKFTFASRKGKTLFTGRNYNGEEECREWVRKLQRDFSNFRIRKERTGSGMYFFSITIEEEVIAKSRKFSTEERLKTAIGLVNNTLPEAEVFDFADEEEVFRD